MSARLTPDQQRLIRELRYEDGLTIQATAARVGCSAFPVRQLAPGRPGKVPNDKLREAFTDSGLSAVEVARRVGWLCSTGTTQGQRTQADGSRVLRTLGLLDDSTKDRRSTRTFIDAETAALLAEAIGVMAWEVMPDEDVAA